MQSPFDGRTIWFLTGSQDLYGEDVLAQVAQQSQQVVAGLNASDELPLNVVWRPILKDRAAIQRAMFEANSDDSVVGVICWMHTFSPAKMWILGLDVLAKPMLHLHTQANEALPWDSIDMDFMNLNQAAHGDREYAYILTRLGVARTTVVGHASNESTRRRVADWIRAAAGFAATNELRVVRFGDNMRNVAVTEGDKTEAERRLGASVNTWGVNDLIAEVESVEESAIDELCALYEAEYEVADELKAGGARHESLRYAARQEIAMRRFLQERKAMAFTTNFEDLGTLRQLPGLAVQRLMAEGYGFGAEGDWKTAVLVRAAKVMGEGLPGGASLMEDYCYNFVEGQEMILGAHMLEICPSLTQRKPRIEIHPLGIGGKEDPVRMVFNADARPGVVVAMSDMRDRFRLTANVVKVVEPPHDMPKLPVARAMWVPEPDFYTSVEAWLTAGAAHHTCMSTQVGVEVWEMFARIAKMELLVIDESTTRRDFASSSKWNQAYHRLAEGL